MGKRWRYGAKGALGCFVKIPVKSFRGLQRRPESILAVFIFVTRKFKTPLFYNAARDAYKRRPEGQISSALVQGVERCRNLHKD